MSGKMNFVLLAMLLAITLPVFSQIDETKQGKNDNSDKAITEKEIRFEYAPLLTGNDQKVIVKIRGNTGAQGILIRDTLHYIEPLADIVKKGMFDTVDVKLLSFRDDGGSEEWTVLWKDGTKKTFKIEYAASPQGGTDIIVSDKK